MDQGRNPWVLHVDLDQFVAAVEVLRRPELAGKPVIVGGRGDPTERAVVSTASYEAREFGVGSGMPLRIAARKAPDAVILPVDAEAYTAASAQVMEVLRAQPGATVQVLGWDEAFIGVNTEDPEGYARQVQKAVLDQTRLHCSVGIGDTLVRAKVATGFGKPRGVFRLTADNWLDVMGKRPTIDLWGVGTKISRRLAASGITTVAELAAADPASLAHNFGPKMGPWYVQLGRGDGERVVDDTPWVSRGHSRETTFQRDLTEPAQIEEAVRELADRVLADVAAEGRPVVGLTLKVRYAPFVTKVLTKRVAETFDRETVLAEILGLVGRIEPNRPIRLLGLRAEMSMPDDAREGHTPTIVSRGSGTPVDDVDALTRAVEGCESVAHCAGINREIGEQTFDRVHVRGTAAVIEAARAAGVRKIVMLSFLRARPGSGSPYHETKWAAEELIRSSGLDYTILKAGMIYGHGDHLIDHLSRTIQTVPLFASVGLREKSISPIPVAELVDVMVAALGDRLPNETVAVRGGETLLLSEAARRIAQVLDRRLIVIPAPVAFHQVLAQFAEWTMKVPLLAKAQARMLAEGVTDAALPATELPDDLRPKLPFNDSQIRAALPETRGFSWRDLRISGSR